MRTCLSCVLLFLVSGWIGCQSSETSAEAPAATPAATQPATESDPPKDPEVTLQVKSWQEVKDWVATQQGKVVVVDVWSTMCLPCMKEFPNFVDMHERLGEQVACASVSVDYIGGKEGVTPEILESVQKFLGEKKSTMANFVSSDSDETVLAEIGAVSVPISLVFDQEGKLHRMFTEGLGGENNGAFTYKQHVEPLVKELLAKGE